MSKRVYFDEPGSTGEDLPNPSDPVFVLASCCFTPEQERSLLRHFSAYRGRELKFSKLRRTRVGHTAIRRFVDAPEIHASTVGIALIHKPFLRVTKYCDLVVADVIAGAAGGALKSPDRYHAGSLAHPPQFHRGEENYRLGHLARSGG
jgi:hypothetical protein